MKLPYLFPIVIFSPARHTPTIHPTICDYISLVRTPGPGSPMVSAFYWASPGFGTLILLSKLAPATDTATSRGNSYSPQPQRTITNVHHIISNHSCKTRWACISQRSHIGTAAMWLPGKFRLMRLNFLC